MAQKYKRQIRKENNTNVTPAVPSSPAYTRPMDFNPDYRYVLKDLRRIAILAVGFLAILVALWFIL